MHTDSTHPGGIVVTYNPKGIEDCRALALELYYKIARHHGPIAARKIFLKIVAPKRSVQLSINVNIFARFLASELSVPKFAAKVAAKLGKKEDTLITAINRMKRRVAEDKELQEWIEWEGLEYEHGIRRWDIFK
jgi:hypothetical protein